jgi:shikimate dehydrogenase
VYVAFEVAGGSGAAALGAAAILGIEGLSVTMPLKEEVGHAVDRLSPVAAALGAVNTVLQDEGGFVGHNTDGDGFVDALRKDSAWEPSGRTCVVVGAGGAARAIVMALAGAGAAEVIVVNRTLARAEAAAALAGPCGRVGDVGDVASADLVVNATPIGMASPAAADSPLAVADQLRGPGQLVVDLVYHPPKTVLLTRAEQLGAATANGLGMLVHQAARAFTLWTEVAAPLEAMRAAAATATAVAQPEA